MASVRHVFRATQRRLPMEELQEARLVADFGVEGCAHGRAGSPRQVLLVDHESLEALQVAPGRIRENITTEGMAVNNLAVGERLRVGDATLEVAAVCTPCDQLEKIRPGLRREIRGRRGMLCRVLGGGLVRRGDRIEKLVAVQLSTQVSQEAS